MPTHCPTCSGAIETDDINVGEGVALCRGCGELHRLTHLLAEPLDDEPADPQSPPACPGDLTGDGVTDSADLNEVLGGFGAAYDSADLNVVLAGFGCDG